jgi:hypothetical protein
MLPPADDFLNWEYAISYSNNMMKFHESLSCDGKDRFDAKAVRVKAPSSTDDFLILGNRLQFYLNRIK